MSNSAPIPRNRAQADIEETSSPLKLKKAQSTRSRPTRSSLRVFQDAPLDTPSKAAGSTRSKTPLQPTSTNILPKPATSSGKLLKGGGALDFKKPTVLKPVVTVEAPAEEIRTPGKPIQTANATTLSEPETEPLQDHQLSRLLARRLLSQASDPHATPIRDETAPASQHRLTMSDFASPLFATPPHQMSYTDRFSPVLSNSKIPTLNPITDVADLLLPLNISPLALSQAYLSLLRPILANQQQSYASPQPRLGSTVQNKLPEEMHSPATHVSTHRLDRSPKAKMRYSPSRQKWFSVEEETGNPRVADDEQAMTSPGSPTRRCAPLKMNGPQTLETRSSTKEKGVKIAQHMSLGLGYPSPLAKTSNVASPVKLDVGEDKDLDDVRRLREASLEFDFVRATASPLSSKLRNAYVPRMQSDTATILPQAQVNNLQTSSTSIPAGFADFLAKTRVVSEPSFTSKSANDDGALDSRRRSKRKKAKLPVPEPESEPLSWDALQQKFVEAQVSDEYETIRSTYEKVAEELEGTP
ncbi:hypothetical protein QFC19_004474 [Naganishia cerealis]|uniref:Uncharacterized protein n=1 Tax=Naganishia cerealis TaxID=610337 RepID=A0ACC2VVA2_9TREE|nr:hypothetical protein QFC19_004474 [Naganishia cerealis]